MEHVLVRGDRIVHVFKNNTAPVGQEGVHKVEPGTAFVGYKWENGAPVKAEIDVTGEEINAECRRRILAVYPIEKQSSIHNHGSEADKQELINVTTWLKQCGGLLKAMQPIPANYRDDKYWIGAHSVARPVAPSQDLPAVPQSAQHGYGHGHGMPAGHVPNGYPNPYGMPHPMMGGYGAPIIMMAPPAQAAPIIVNGAAPQGPMVFQNPGQTSVVMPQAAPMAHPVMAAAGSASLPAPPPLALAVPGSSPGPVSAAAAPTLDQGLVWETAEAAAGGSLSARAILEPVAQSHGMTLQQYIETLLQEKFSRLRSAVDQRTAAHG